MLTQKLFLNTLGENGRPDFQNRSRDGINFLGMYLQTLDYFTEHHRNLTWNPELQNRPELTIKYLQHVYKKQEVSYSKWHMNVVTILLVAILGVLVHLSVDYPRRRNAVIRNSVNKIWV